LRERAKSQGSALCDGQNVGCYYMGELAWSCEVCVCYVAELVRGPVLVVSPGSPFIASRGGRYLHESLEISSVEWRSNSPDPVEACPSRR